MDAYIGEIRAFGFSFIPQNWLPCFGQVLSARDYQALYALLGNAYGGSAQSLTFGLPNLQGMAMIGQGEGLNLTPRIMTKQYGTASETLTSESQIGAHTHTVNVMVPASGSNVQANTLSTPVAGNSWLSQEANISDATHFKYPKSYIPATTAPTFNAQFTAQTVSPSCGTTSGGVLPHSNIQPYLTMYVCICWNGVFPSFN